VCAGDLPGTAETGPRQAHREAAVRVQLPSILHSRTNPSRKRVAQPDHGKASGVEHGKTYRHGEQNRVDFSEGAIETAK